MSKFNALQIKLDKDYLNKLTEDPSSGVFKQNCKYHVALHPAQFSDFGTSIKDELCRKIAKYDDIFQGIMLGYENIKLQTDLGVMGIDNCYVHIDIQADFFVFRPETGMILKGVVTRTTKDHVGCLVYSTFNISLPKPAGDDEDWLGNKATIQSDVVFKIIFGDLNARLPFIKGELLSILSYSKGTKKGKKLNKKIKFENLDEDGGDESPKPKKKHKKKRNKDEESIEFLEMNGEDFEESNINKNRKRKTLEDNEEEDVTTSKKRHKKKHNSVIKPVENLEIKDDFWVDVPKAIKLEDGEEEVDYTMPAAKKKHKKSHNKDGDSLNNFVIKQEDLWEEEVRTQSKKHKNKKQIPDYDDQVLKKKEKRREKKERQERDAADLSQESLEINFLFDDSYLSSNSKISRQTVDDSTPNSKDKKKHNKNDQPMEILEINGEVFEETNINKNRTRKTLEENGTTLKKGHKNKHNLVSESLENLEKKDQDDGVDVPKAIKLEDNEEEEDYTMPAAKKKHKKSHNKKGDKLNSFEIKQEDLWEEEIRTKSKKYKKRKQIPDYDDQALKKKEKRREKKERQERDAADLSLESLDIKFLFDDSYASANSKIPRQTVEDSTPTSKDKKKHSKNDQLFDNVVIKQENLEEETISKKLRKHKKIEKPEYNDEVSKKEKRREKKKRQEQDEADTSLGSLDLKTLFDSGSISVNSSYSPTMANDQDRGKKRRKSNSVSQEVYLENVKLEEDSELEAILFGKKRKRSKSFST